ncbi:hypothetical protein BS47DRAFT_1172744 [Hydnum rufescens UP504]|uniref:Uncharacterized protein n=1 Tax=Hydnum rufescens UP504 TaxID=1448309 RepID=A0A9P6AT34_9AGAM|nr:hypothetical protein BS47DRAFT_1172744 [Hydnum rufescens UP504]
MCRMAVTTLHKCNTIQVTFYPSFLPGGLKPLCGPRRCPPKLTVDNRTSWTARLLSRTLFRLTRPRGATGENSDAKHTTVTIEELDGILLGRTSCSSPCFHSSQMMILDDLCAPRSLGRPPFGARRVPAAGIVPPQLWFHIPLKSSFSLSIAIAMRTTIFLPQLLAHPGHLLLCDR